MVQLRGRPGDAVKQEGDECDAVLRREAAVTSRKAERVGLAEVRRGLHAGEHHRHVPLTRALDDGREIPPEFAGA